MTIFILLIVVLALLLLFRGERRKHVGRQELLSAGYPISTSGRTHLLRGLCLALAIILLAAGMLLLPEAKSQHESAPPVLFCLLDCSLSMQAESAAGNTRLEEAKEYLLAITGELPEWELALLTFAGSAFLDFPPSIDHHSWQQALAAVQTEFAGSPGSAPGEVLKLAQDSAGQLGITDAVLFLLSDGEINTADPIGEENLWEQRRFPCIHLLCGKEGEERPVPDSTGWLQISTGGIALSKPEGAALRHRLELAKPLSLQLRTEDADASSAALAAIRRFNHPAESSRASRRLSRSPLPTALLGLSLLLLLAGLAPSCWPWFWHQPAAIILLVWLFVIGGVGSEAESALSLTQRGYALCREAQEEQASAKWHTAADCFRRALHLQPGFPAAALNLEFALRELSRCVASAQDISAEPKRSSAHQTPNADREPGGLASTVPPGANLGATTEDDDSENRRPGRNTWRALQQRRPGRRILVPDCLPW